MVILFMKIKSIFADFNRLIFSKLLFMDINRTFTTEQRPNLAVGSGQGYRCEVAAEMTKIEGRGGLNIALERR